MTYWDVWISDPDDPDFTWEQGEGEFDHSPEKLKGCPAIYHRAMWFTIMERIKDGTYQGKQLDWGSWVAKVNKKQIRELCEEVGSVDKEFISFIESLKDDRVYALVIEEF